MPILYAGRLRGAAQPYPIYRYFRFRFFGAEQSNDYMIIGNVEMAATPGGANYVSGQTVTGSSGTPGLAFDGNPASAGWVVSCWGEYAQIDLVTPTALAQVDFYPQTSLTNYLKMPRAVAIAGSDDGTTLHPIGIYPLSTWSSTASQSVLVTNTSLVDLRANARMWWLAGTGVASSAGAGPTLGELVWGATQQATGGKAVGGTTFSTNVVDNLYDGSDITVYLANAWLFGSTWFQPGNMGYLWPSPINLTQYSTIARGTGSPVGDPPSGWTVNWTSDGFNDHTTDTESGQTGWTLSQVRTFSISP